MGFSDMFDDNGEMGDFSNWNGGEESPLLPIKQIGSTVGSLMGFPSSGGGQNHSSGSIMDRLLGRGGQNMADLGSALGAFSSGQKANRVVQGNFTQNYDRLMMDAQAERNANESDAMKKLAQTSYIAGGGSQFKPANLSIGGKSYTGMDLGYGPPKVSDAEKTGANTLQSQLQARLMPGGSYTPQPLNDYAKPGTAEQAASYGALGASGLGSLSGILGGGGGGESGATSALGQGSSLASSVGGIGKMLSGAAGDSTSGISGALGSAGGLMSKALPIAGIGAGIYGLIKNKGLGSNLLSGAGAGASLGSMIMPGVGTAIGAGLGALGGGVRSLFNIGKPDETELNGRDIEGNFEKGFGGFQGMMNNVGSGYASHGHTSEEAQADVKAMMDAEKKGGPAVNSIIQSIMSKMGQGQGGASAPGGLVTDAFSAGARR